MVARREGNDWHLCEIDKQRSKNEIRGCVAQREYAKSRPRFVLDWGGVDHGRQRKKGNEGKRILGMGLPVRMWAGAVQRCWDLARG